jgi:hypothetical protein
MHTVLQPLGRPTVFAIAVGLLVICLLKFGRGPLAEILEDYRETRHWQRVLADGQKRGADLQVGLDRRWARQKAKNQIVNDMVAGRITVHDAVRQYCALPDAPHNFMECLRVSERGATDHERLCRHLIDYACYGFEDESVALEVRRRLTEELESSMHQE